MKEQRQGGFLIAKVHQLSGRIFSKILKEHSITEINPAQGRILFVLWGHDEIPITELSKKTQLEKSTLTAMLDHLEHDGYIRRIASKDDRRKIIIKRTEKDKSFQKAYYQVSDEMTARFYKDFSDRDIDLFEKYLERILNNLMESDQK
jgi:MarR family transcriptional regulator, organic hydroperoxide resistance regulator